MTKRLPFDPNVKTKVGDQLPSGSGGLNEPYDLAFGPNGNLFVTSYQTNSILEYNGTTGAFITQFVPSGSGGLTQPTSGATGKTTNEESRSGRGEQLR